MLINNNINYSTVVIEFLVDLIIGKLCMCVVFFLLVKHLLYCDLITEVSDQDDVSFFSVYINFMLTNSNQLVIFLQFCIAVIRRKAFLFNCQAEEVRFLSRLKRLQGFFQSQDRDSKVKCV
jgi:hypothetical protein